MKGSYGIVKLAYNKEDDSHYVSFGSFQIDFFLFWYRTNF